jgi:hypothetical protein
VDLSSREWYIKLLEMMVKLDMLLAKANVPTMSTTKTIIYILDAMTAERCTALTIKQ